MKERYAQLSLGQKLRPSGSQRVELDLTLVVGRLRNKGQRLTFLQKGKTEQSSAHQAWAVKGWLPGTSDGAQEMTHTDVGKGRRCEHHEGGLFGIPAHPLPGPRSGPRCIPTHTLKTAKHTLRVPAMSSYSSWETPHHTHQAQAQAQPSDTDHSVLKKKITGVVSVFWRDLDCCTLAVPL